MKPNFMHFSLRALVCIIAFILVGSGLVQGQGLDLHDRELARAMLKAAKEDLKKNYYDPTLRDIDIDARFKEAEAKIAQASTRDQLMIVVAQTLLDFNDSHTFFLPHRLWRPVYGHPLLRAAAVAAARSAKFTPTRLAGQPVKVTGVITNNFVAE